MTTKAVETLFAFQPEIKAEYFETYGNDVEDILANCLTLSKQSAPTTKKLKINFVPKNYVDLDNILQQCDVLANKETFTEEHIFKKDFFNVFDNIQVKLVAKLDDCALTVRRVKQIGKFWHLSEAHEELDLYTKALHDVITVKLLIQRLTYSYKSIPGASITIDHVEYPEGDVYTVASFCLENVSDEVLRFVESNSEVANSLHVDAAQSKIVTYLRRYKSAIYNKMLEEKIIGQCNKVLPLYHLFLTVHPLTNVDANCEQATTRMELDTIMPHDDVECTVGDDCSFMSE